MIFVQYFTQIYVENITHDSIRILAEINLNLVKSSIFVSMATMEATWLLGMFQLLIQE